ncbi:phosphatidic acid phosphatase type 2/haloperoxidase [Massariosphaeria phaeospora]|uniref:Phosphatidic acid phosphatase type 2/haloperoxidase n=1 Tax=Massariosphaeria phaeospora TaxID=100035 RepID=A0A7C8I9P1_9PLEO|nr:phosphatidic acid phosphatase type 2/haloperoxidase [Massariosphaeria phaeospora]
MEGHKDSTSSTAAPPLEEHPAYRTSAVPRPLSIGSVQRNPTNPPVDGAANQPNPASGSPAVSQASVGSPSRPAGPASRAFLNPRTSPGQHNVPSSPSSRPPTHGGTKPLAPISEARGSHPSGPHKPPVSRAPGPDLEKNSPNAGPKKRRFALAPDQPPSFMYWLRRNWLDILTQLLCVGAAYAIYRAASPRQKFFPYYPGIERSDWGLRHSQPYRSEYINTIVSAVLSFVVPLIIISLVGLLKDKSYWNTNNAVQGLGYALSTACLFQAILKWLIGGYRPHFLSVCRPDPGLVVGRGAGGVWLPIGACTGPDKRVREAMMSWPSGHAVAAFAGMTYLAHYLARKFRMFKQRDAQELARKQQLANEAAKREEELARKDGRPAPAVQATVPVTATEAKVAKKQTENANGGRPHHWKMMLWALPLLAATLLAASKVADGWHHPIDVISGGIIGSLFGTWAWRMANRREKENRAAQQMKDEMAAADLWKQEMGVVGQDKDMDAARFLALLTPHKLAALEKSKTGGPQKTGTTGPGGDSPRL